MTTKTTKNGTPRKVRMNKTLSVFLAEYERVSNKFFALEDDPTADDSLVHHCDGVRVGIRLVLNKLYGVTPVCRYDSASGKYEFHLVYL